jgi:hypothetical protein
MSWLDIGWLDLTEVYIQPTCMHPFCGYEIITIFTPIFT